jgi:imidazole glycerol-phosphate synthase subunit HisH
MLTIVDYGVGNLTSIQNMLKKGGIATIISGKPDDVAKAEKIVLPGMGHFDNCMKKLNASGLRSIIEEKVMVKKIPVLGICVGLQMYMENSEEGTEAGLGWIKGNTVRFKANAMTAEQKIPNMGWLEVQVNKPLSGLLHGLEDSRFYFAHSFHVEVKNENDKLLSAHYGYDFTVAIERENILGVQFHPEKSHRFGMKLLNNFANFF